MITPASSQTSSTSITRPPHQFSSARRTEAEAVIEDNTATRPSQRDLPKWITFIEEQITWILTSLGGLVAAFIFGLIAYYNQIDNLKTSINENKTNISVLQTKIGNAEQTLDKLETKVDKISEVKTDLAVIKAKMENK